MEPVRLNLREHPNFRGESLSHLAGQRPVTGDPKIPLGVKLWFALCTLIGLALVGLAVWLVISTLQWLN